MIPAADTHPAPHHNTYGKAKDESEAANTTAEGTQNMIVSEIQSQETAPSPPPPPPPPPPPRTDGTVQGYSAGIYEQKGDPDGRPYGTLSSQSPSGVTATFDATNQTVTADVSMQADRGANGGGVRIRFGDPEFNGSSSFDDDLNFSSSAAKGSITVLSDGEPAVLHSGSGEFTGGGEAFCSDCGFLRWGGWNTHLVFDSGGSPATNVEGNGQGNTNVFGHGWWIAGDIIDQSDMPTDGSASYTGKAIGDVASNPGTMGWVTYTAKGDLVMTWDFGARAGDLTISKFDTQHIDGGLTFTGHMTAPGEVGLNQFSGPLSGKDLPDNLSDLSGSATGSFVRGPDNIKDGRIISGSKPQGVIGNWTVDSSKYTAGGIFGGSRDK